MQGTTSFITAKSSRVISFGCILLLIGGLLAIYYHYKSPITVEDYYFTDISHQKIYLNEDANKIVIVSDTKEYGLPILLLNSQEKTNAAEVLNKLSLTTKSEVWLNDKNANSPFIRGIRTDNFYLSPEIGAIEDTKDNQDFAEICSYFAIGGIVIIILGFIQFFSDKRVSKTPINGVS